MTEQKIYYKKVRDLGGIFSATFGFIKQNFKPLYGSLLFFAGPFLLVAAAISANAFGAGLSMGRIFKGGLGSLYAEFLVPYLITICVLFVGITIYNVILNKNIIESEKLQSQEPLTINHSINNFFSDFWRVLTNTLLLIFIFIIFFIILALIFGAIYALAGGGAGNNTAVIVLMVLFVILLFAFMLIFGPIISFVLIAAIFVCQKDRIPIFAAIKKVFYYLKGNFWNTWVVIMVGFLTYFIMTFVVQIPMLILTLITTFSRLKVSGGYNFEDQNTSLIMVIVVSICSLLSYGVRVIFNLIVTYQYTSLEEKKEGISIIEKINQI